MTWSSIAIHQQIVSGQLSCARKMKMKIEMTEVACTATTKNTGKVVTQVDPNKKKK